MSIQQPFTAACLAASLLAGASLAQGGPPTWSRTYGGPVAQQGLYDIKELDGGRLAVAGFTGSFGGPSSFNWLMQLELGTGDVLVERASSSAFGGFTDGATLAADGGALFLGRNVHDIFLKHDAWLMRVDAAGDVQWSRGFGTPGAGRHFLFDAAELADGSWIAVGSTGVLDHPPQAAWVVRLTSAGVPLWQAAFGGGIVETARSVALTLDGGFVVAGTTNSTGAGSDDVWVMKLDASGATQWQRTFGGLDVESAEEIVALDDGGFAIAGSTNSLTASGHAPWILRLDPNGALDWHKVVESDVWGDLGAVAQTRDGDLIVVGRVGQPGFPSNDLWCAKLDADNGSSLWQRAYEGDSGDFGSAVLPLAGPGFILGGTWGWGFADESIWLQRTDRAGGLADCDLARRTHFALSSPPLTVGHGPTVMVETTAQLQAAGAQLAPSAAEVTTICR